MAQQNAHFHPNQQIVDAIASTEQLLMLDECLGDQDNHPLLESFVDDMLQDPSDELFGIRLDGNVNNENSIFTGFPQIGNPLQIPIWPVPPFSHSCTCCHTLRQFYHTNGSQVLKLDVHGRLGLISHAVLERYDSNNYLSSENHQYHMFDFSQESIISVKQFLVQYCDDRKREGYVMLQDPLSSFYNALCIGLDGADCLNSGGDRHTNQSEGDGIRVNKSYLASQRKIMRKMKLRDFARHFHRPIHQCCVK